jgi:uncharacterized protein YndB with AHSA1/START domain
MHIRLPDNAPALRQAFLFGLWLLCPRVTAAWWKTVSRVLDLWDISVYNPSKAEREALGRVEVKIEFEVSDIIPASPGEIYTAWLDSKGHFAMTGSPAKASPEVGAEFAAWEGYIHGRNLELEPGKRIVQAWRTTEFDPADEDSILEITFKPVKGGTRIKLRHKNLPLHGTIYREGWVENYFLPMKEYFSR